MAGGVTEDSEMVGFGSGAAFFGVGAGAGGAEGAECAGAVFFVSNEPICS